MKQPTYYGHHENYEGRVPILRRKTYELSLDLTNILFASKLYKHINHSVDQFIPPAVFKVMQFSSLV